jgi:hypothetical protein
VHEARTEEMGTVHKARLKKSQGKGTGALWDVWGINIEILLKKILHQELLRNHSIGPVYIFSNRCVNSSLMSSGLMLLINKKGKCGETFFLT